MSDQSPAEPATLALDPPKPITQAWIDQRVFDLYDEYCHGRIDRREFLARAARWSSAASRWRRRCCRATRSADDLVHRYAHQGEVREYPSPGGNSGKMRGYLVQPSGQGPFPAVLVIHENRGLNPYIEDVARRAAVEGFLALAPDGLSPVGGYPGNDDDGRTLQAGLDQAKLRTDMVNSARYLKAHELLDRQARRDGLLLGRRHGQLPRRRARRRHARRRAVLRRGRRDGRRAEDQGAAADPVRGDRRAHQRDVAGVRGRAEGRSVPHEKHIYPGTQHGFHNNSTPRYNEAAANLAWERTVAFFKKHLA